MGGDIIPIEGGRGGPQTLDHISAILWQCSPLGQYPACAPPSFCLLFCLHAIRRSLKGQALSGHPVLIYFKPSPPAASSGPGCPAPISAFFRAPLAPPSSAVGGPLGVPPRPPPRPPCRDRRETECLPPGRRSRIRSVPCERARRGCAKARDPAPGGHILSDCHPRAAAVLSGLSRDCPVAVLWLFRGCWSSCACPTVVP